MEESTRKNTTHVVKESWTRTEEKECLAGKIKKQEKRNERHRLTERCSKPYQKLVPSFSTTSKNHNPSKEQTSFDFPSSLSFVPRSSPTKRGRINPVNGEKNNC